MKKDTTPLNDQERALLSENYGVCLKFFNEREIFDDDIKQFILMRLCVAIKKFDPTKSAISTFIYMNMKHSYYSYNTYRIREEKRYPAETSLRLDAETSIHESNTATLENISTYHEIIGDPKTTMNNYIYEQTIYDIINDLDTGYFKNISEKDAKIFKSYIANPDLKELAARYGCTKSNISRVVLKVQAVLRANSELYGFTCAHDALDKPESKKTQAQKIREDIARQNIKRRAPGTSVECDQRRIYRQNSTKKD